MLVVLCCVRSALSAEARGAGPGAPWPADDHPLAVPSSAIGRREEDSGQHPSLRCEGERPVHDGCPGEDALRLPPSGAHA